MITGWELLEPARRQGARFVRAVVRFGDHAHEVALDRLGATLEAQVYQDDFALDDPEVENQKFDFVVWDDADRLWYRSIRDGLVELRSMPSTPLSWLAAQQARLSQFDELDIERERYESARSDLGSLADGEYEAVPITPELEQRHADDMRKRGLAMPGRVGPEGLPDSVAERLPQLADAPGGRIVLDVGDLSAEELELIADSEIPPALRWSSEDGLPPHMIELDIGSVDAAALVYSAAVVAAGGAYGHALAAVWRAWPRDGGDE